MVKSIGSIVVLKFPVRVTSTVVKKRHHLLKDFLLGNPLDKMEAGHGMDILLGSKSGRYAM
jgi:hypothetical protein